MDYGLEVGSKFEFIIVMSYINFIVFIIVNGFKDKEMIEFGFIVKSMQYEIILIIEGLNELKIIIVVVK